MNTPRRKHPGDDGTAELLDRSRVSKNDVRMHNVGTIDEVSSLLGLAVALGAPEPVARDIARVQKLLISAAVPFILPHGAASAPCVDHSASWLRQIDAITCRAERGTPAAHSFILPGGAPSAAALHVARTASRRLERLVVQMHEQQRLPLKLRAVFNRLGTLLFALARQCNHLCRA